MSRAANSAKTKWNSAHYAQVKVSVDPGIAATFKTACATNGVSMAGELSRFMDEYSAVAKKRNDTEPGSLSTRRKRRKSVADIVSRLEMIRDAESLSHENIPENLRGAEAYEATEEIISALDEAVELLGGIY